MKKYTVLFLLLLVSIFVIPSHVFAKDFTLIGTTSETISEAFDAEGIVDYDLSNYSETGDKVPIILFRKNGCINCKNFLIYLKEVLLPKYGDKFKLVSYELSSNQSNYNLLDQVAHFFNNAQSSGYSTPYLVVGEKTFSGAIYHNDAMRAEIEATIQSGTTFDVIEEMTNGNQNINNNQIFTDNNITLTSKQVFTSDHTLKVVDVDLQNVLLDSFRYIHAYDISMYQGGVKVALKNGSFQIKIPVTEKYDIYKVAYIENGNIMETFEPVYENGYITFTTNHLSEYAIYGKNHVITSSGVEEENPNTLDGIDKNIIMLVVGSMMLLGSTVLYKKFN